MIIFFVQNEYKYDLVFFLYMDVLNLIYTSMIYGNEL